MGTGYAGDEADPRGEDWTPRLAPLATHGLLGRSVTNVLQRHERAAGVTGWVVAAFLSRRGPHECVRLLVEREDGRLEEWSLDNGYRLGPSRKQVP